MNKNNRLLYSLALLRFILPFLIVPSFYQLHRDEYLYLAEGHHPAWGFMEVPPMLSFLAWISQALGAGMFWVKFWPALLGSFTFILTGRIVLSLGGRRFALVLAFLPFLFTGYIRLFYFFHPNFLDVFFWTLNAYSLIRFIQASKNYWLYLLGLSIGLGMLSKYSVAFYAISLLAGLALTRERKIFLNKHLYIAGALALLIMLPNILWQYQHRWPLVTHMKELQEEQLQLLSPVNFFISQLLLFLPCIFTWVAGLLFTGMSREGRPFRFVAWAYVAVILLLVALHGKDYYAMGAYPVLFAFGAYYLEKLTTTGAQKTWRYAILLFTLILGGFSIPILMPVARPATLAAWYQKINLAGSGALRWEDQQNHPLPQDFADMIGWRELAEKTAGVLKSLPPEEQQRTLIYCRGYFTAGALNYHAKRLGLPQVYSDNASFLFWMPEKYHIKNLIMVGHQIPGKDDIVFRQFEKMSIRDSMTDPLFRENGIRVFLYENGNGQVNDLIEKGIAGMKSKFSRH